MLRSKYVISPPSTPFLSSYCSFYYRLHCSLEINAVVRAHGKSQTIENHVRSIDRSRSSTNQIISVSIRILTCFFRCSQWQRNASINPLFGGSETMKNVTSITSFGSNVTFKFFSIQMFSNKNSQDFPQLLRFLLSINNHTENVYFPFIFRWITVSSFLPRKSIMHKFSLLTDVSSKLFKLSSAQEWTIFFYSIKNCIQFSSGCFSHEKKNRNSLT